MKTYSVLYDSILTFHFLPTEEINRAKSVLVVVQTGLTSHKSIEKILHECALFFPNATVVGCAAAGIVLDGKMRENQTLITIYTFERTKVTTYALEGIDYTESFEAGKRLARRAVRKDAALGLLMADTLGVDSESLFHGVSTQMNGTPIVGAMAADRTLFDTFVFHGEHVLRHGAVLVILSGESLHIDLRHHTFLRSIGPVWCVDEARKDRLLKIHGENAIEFLLRYLGEDFVAHFGELSRHIGLIDENNGIARSFLLQEDKGIVRCAGHIDPDGRWRFTIPSEEPREVELAPGMWEAVMVYGDISHLAAESLCIRPMLEALQRRLPTTGMLGYGQFYAQGNVREVLNQSFVVVSLSEAPVTRSEEAPEKLTLCGTGKEPDVETAEVLAHLGTVLLEEASLKTVALEALMDEIDQGTLLYDTHLRLIAANDRAKNLLGLEVKAPEGTLDHLEPWIVMLLKSALDGEVRTKVEQVMEVSSARNTVLRIDVRPLKSYGRIVGALAFVHPGDCE